MMTKDNRKHIRIDSINLTYFALDENDKIVKQSIGRTLNVSESGILLETYIPVDLKQAILLAIGLEDDVVDIKGNVIYSADCKNGKYKTGIEFYNVDETAFQILKLFIDYFNKHERKG
ncbi:MAG: PilZ domain-containing protein [Desulfosarcina sp.]|nr:PilZ domain-containing protein [Desulfobacterales bacterium]